jgi:hypothetical protein
MQDFKLDSQQVSTEKDPSETIAEFQLRHERMMRITAEGQLIKALCLLDSIDRGDLLEENQIADFLRGSNSDSKATESK